jgi:hypothetical protein
MHSRLITRVASPGSEAKQKNLLASLAVTAATLRLESRSMSAAKEAAVFVPSITAPALEQNNPIQNAATTGGIVVSPRFHVHTRYFGPANGQFEMLRCASDGCQRP